MKQRDIKPGRPGRGGAVIQRKVFRKYQDNALAAFSRLPSWVFATAHGIRASTSYHSL